MLAFDKNVFGSNREFDGNGYLRVSDCNITKTQVAPYLAQEIPNWKNFNLERDKIYYVLRPEAELKKAVESFNNLPLTRKHIEVDVDNVPKEDIIGSLGDSAVFENGYLKNNIIVYDQKYIDRIENGKQKELSCGYRYTPVRESGEYNGQHYDFVMKDIIGNHVALVKEGRAGHDVMVSDTIETVKDKIMGLFGKKQIVGDEFKESEHPRARNGQFTSKGGEGSGSKEESSKSKTVFKSDLTPHIVNKNDKKTYKMALSAAKQDLEEAIKGFERNAEKVDEKYKWIEKARADKARKDLERLKTFEEEGLTEDVKLSEKEQEKVGVVMKEFKEGELESGSGKKVTDPKQAIAIALSEADKVSDGQKKPETAGEGKADKEDDKMEEKKKESLAEDKCAKDEKVDKRKLIDEVGGILKGKVDEELWRTVIGKIEKIAYNDSEAGTTNDEDKIENKKDFAEGVEYGEKKEKEEPKKLDSEHESEGMKKFEEKKEAEDKCGKMAKDEMTFDIDSIKAQVREEVIADFKAREEARKSVKSTLGEINVMAFDSCEDIYKLACEKAGLNVDEIASYKDAFKGFSAGKSVKGGLALDATPKSSGNLEECLKDIRS